MGTEFNLKCKASFPKLGTFIIILAAVFFTKTLDGKELVREWFYGPDIVLDVAVDQDGYIYSASADHELHKINPNGKKEWAYTGHENNVWDVALDEDGYVYSTSNAVHKIGPNGEKKWEYTGHNDRVKGVAVDEDGYVHSASRDEEVHKISSDGKKYGPIPSMMIMLGALT